MVIEETRTKRITYVFSESEVIQALFERFLRQIRTDRERISNYDNLIVVVNDGGFHHTITEMRLSVDYLDEEDKDADSK